MPDHDAEYRSPGPESPNPESPAPPPPTKRTPAVSQARSYAQYSGIAISMIVILLLAHYGGDYLLRTLGSDSPLLKAGTLLVGVGLALWLPLRGLLK